MLSKDSDALIYGGIWEQFSGREIVLYLVENPRVADRGRVRS